MNLLLDTHVVFWWLIQPEKLSTKARTAIETADSVFVSAASAWEIATKVRLGKWESASDLFNQLAAHLAVERFDELAITFRHAELAGRLPSDHGDPFDRILAAQAELENLILVSVDPAFETLGVSRFW